MLPSLTNWLRTHEKFAVLLFLLIGFVERIIWTLDPKKLEIVTSESHNVAVSLATTGRFAEPLMNGSGYTAHVSMLTPLPSAVAYYLLGVDTEASEFALSFIAIALVCISIWLCWRIAGLLGTSWISRLLTIAVLSLVPLQFGLEVREARNWENDWATVLLLWSIYRVIRADKIETSSRYHAATGLIVGVLFILNPPAGLGAIATLALFVLQNRIPKVSLYSIGIAASVVAILGGAWAVRNNIRLGQSIPFRDNFGLELAIANYPGALHPSDFRAEYLARINDIHPLREGPANAKLFSAGGELPYYQKLGREAEAWIWSHPRDFLYLSARRYANFYLPPRWFWGTFGRHGRMIGFRQFVVWTLTIPGMIFLAFMSYKDRRYRYVFAAIIGCSLIFIIIQPMLRYRYLISSIIILMSFDGASYPARRIWTELVART